MPCKNYSKRASLTGRGSSRPKTCGGLLGITMATYPAAEIPSTLRLKWYGSVIKGVFAGECPMV